MPAQHADHSRHCEGCKAPAALGIEPVDCLQEADRSDLDGVLELFAPVSMAPRERADEGEVETDELLARREVPAFAVCAEEAPRLGLPSRCHPASVLADD